MSLSEPYDDRLMADLAAAADGTLPPARQAELEAMAEDDPELAAALDELGARGAENVLAEGGPTLNGELARADLLDELCVTLSPRLASGDAKRIIAGSTLHELRELNLRSICEDGDFLFLRYRPTP